jgi:glutamate-1-semialdehyde 2,1-aminomutase
MQSPSATIDRKNLDELLARERAEYVSRTPRSRALFEQADHLFGRVPMTWMNKWSGGYPEYLVSARGNRVTTVDGHQLVDFALGDTGAMAGHSPAPTVAAVTERIGRLGGATTMLPTADAEWVAAELARRFGLPLWSFTLSATDANRWAIRLARLVTGRPRVLVFAYGYHGSVDETFAVRGPDGETRLRPGSVGAPVNIALTTRAAEWNDLESVERALAPRDVAVIVTEPALTNIGIVLPEPGFLAGLRELASRHGSLLLFDETHTISAGPGGATGAWGLDPDILTVGKSIGGGVPAGAYAITAQLADRVSHHAEADLVDVGGVGGTLAGNALSVAAMRATLEHVLTPPAFEHMIALATRFAAGVERTLLESGVPWSVSQLGARVEYRFARPAPRSGTHSAAAHDGALEEYLHLFLANRGVLLTPFHNMSLMCPETSPADVELHTHLFAEAVAALLT